MKCFNLKAILGMGFLSILFAPVWGNPEQACEQLAGYIEHRSGDPRTIMSQIITCWGCHPEYKEATRLLREAAAARNPLTSGKLIAQALTVLPQNRGTNRLRSAVGNLGNSDKFAVGMAIKSAIPR